MVRSNMHQFLYAAGLCLYLLLPTMLCGNISNLLCYFSPLLAPGETFNLTVTTECPPGELCFTAGGHYGNYSALTAWGCMAEGNCSQVLSLPFKGTVFAMHYDCCDWNHCNSLSLSRAAAKSVPLRLILAAVVTMLANM